MLQYTISCGYLHVPAVPLTHVCTRSVWGIENARCWNICCVAACCSAPGVAYSSALLSCIAAISTASGMMQMEVQYADHKASPLDD
jgi:hypothetical protein